MSILDGFQKKMGSKILLSFYSRFESKIIEIAKDIKLEPGELFPAIILTERNGEIYYIICTFDEQRKVVRQIKIEKVRTLIENMNIDTQDMNIMEMMTE
jgi:hypothetical protein